MIIQILTAWPVALSHELCIIVVRHLLHVIVSALQSRQLANSTDATMISGPLSECKDRASLLTDRLDAHF